MNKSNHNFIIDIILFFNGILLSFSGLIISAKYHAEHLPKDVKYFIFNYYSWSFFHKVMSVVCFFLVCYHLYLHKTWVLKNLISRDTVKKKSIFPIIVFFIGALTGFIPWIISMSIIFSENIHLRRTIIEIHDKLGIILIILLIFHLTQKYFWIKAMVKKMLRLKNFSHQ